MLFRPSFCANCGEKVERSDWGLFTSRRFCAVCESEFKGHDLLPRAVVAVSVLVGIFGFGSYLKSGNAEPQLARLASQPIERPVAAATRDALPANVVAATPVQPQPQTASNAIPQAKSAMSVPPAGQIAKNSAANGIYMCGAMTRKGTPCTRRVHGALRCFQHQGQPAMVPQDKLRIG